MGRRGIVVLLTGAEALVSIAAGAPAGAQGVEETCELPIPRFDPAIVNVASPDDSAQYWSGHYQLTPGFRLKITGRFPHARYISFHVYDAAQRPLDHIADRDI